MGADGVGQPHETMTAVEHDIPAVALVFNNQQGAESAQPDRLQQRPLVGTNIATIGGFNFAEIARSMGADATRISELGDLGGLPRRHAGGQGNGAGDHGRPGGAAEQLLHALQQPVRHLERCRHRAHREAVHASATATTVEGRRARSQDWPTSSRPRPPRCELENWDQEVHQVVRARVV